MHRSKEYFFFLFNQIKTKQLVVNNFHIFAYILFLYFLSLHYTKRRFLYKESSNHWFCLFHKCTNNTIWKGQWIWISFKCQQTLLHECWSTGWMKPISMENHNQSTPKQFLKQNAWSRYVNYLCICIRLISGCGWANLLTKVNASHYFFLLYIHFFPYTSLNCTRTHNIFTLFFSLIWHLEIFYYAQFLQIIQKNASSVPNCSANETKSIFLLHFDLIPLLSGCTLHNTRHFYIVFFSFLVSVFIVSVCLYLKH